MFAFEEQTLCVVAVLLLFFKLPVLFTRTNVLFALGKEMIF